MLRNSIVLALITFFMTSSLQSTQPPATLEELWAIVQKQQAQIEELQRELAATQQQLQVTDTRVEATGDLVEEVAEMQVDEPARKATRLGSYGELHYNAGDKQELDFHRFVLFLSHDFNDKISFFSELEVEHALAGDGKPGEVELEQAFLRFNLGLDRMVRAGIFLIPVGILNETHEPNTFYGVERNPVEKNIIPSTWWEGGAMFSHRVGEAFVYDLAIHSGLETSSDKNYAVRSGRQKVAKASAEDLAYTGRLKYTGIPGLEVAATLQYQGDMTQSADPLAGSATLVEGHVVYQRGRLGLRGLWAQWNLDGEGPESAGADVQAGWYIEPSYRLGEHFGLFARYSEWDNQRGASADSSWGQIDVGVNYWPHPNVVIKLDYQIQDAPDGKSEDDRFNLGLGYSF